MKTSPCTQVIVIVLTFGFLCEVHAQNYHFSNGWQPGKRSYKPCALRPEIRSILYKIIEDEVERIQKCTNSNFDDVFSMMQDKNSVDAREV
ncbi:prepro-gonadotropin-releasing hormone-like protein [Saccostrea cucullata]|uniref:prepro-gonadotropin-releasing hormone-like protein n=1 Tax=Saccostrea cuccullata TaxID=36930 RepID=UPI002ED54D16